MLTQAAIPAICLSCKTITFVEGTLDKSFMIPSF